MSHLIHFIDCYYAYVYLNNDLELKIFYERILRTPSFYDLKIMENKPL